MMPAVVSLERRGSVAVVILDRPRVRNAISSQLLDELRDALGQMDADPTVHGIVLTGRGSAFCAGVDLDDLSNPIHNLLTRVDGRINGAPWRQPGKPLIGAVNGPAVAAGLELALHCDFLIGSTSAWFADTHASVGEVPGWGMTFLLPELVGAAVAQRMSLTGEPLTAAEALRLGLLTEVVDGEVLVDRAAAIGEMIAARDTSAVREVLAAYRAGRRATSVGAAGIEEDSFRRWGLRRRSSG